MQNAKATARRSKVVFAFLAVAWLSTFVDGDNVHLAYPSVREFRFWYVVPKKQLIQLVVEI